MSANTNELVIEAGRTEKNYWKDLWNYRELFYILSWRDIKVRYKQTVLGAAWAVVRPLLTMLVFTFVFGRLGGLSKPGDIPYPILVFAACCPGNFLQPPYPNPATAWWEIPISLLKFIFPASLSRPAPLL
jgi:lipopolysaccharide transport system permease protein